MISNMLYDVFANEYTKEMDPNAPPERYIPTYRGNKGMYEETWEVEDNNCNILNITYTIDEYYDSERHNARFKLVCGNHKPVKLRSFTLPEEKFDEYVHLFGLEQHDS